QPINSVVHLSHSAGMDDVLERCQRVRSAKVVVDRPGKRGRQRRLAVIDVADGSDVHMNLVHHDFSSLSCKADSIRWPGETVGGLSARAPDLRCPRRGRKKSLRGWTTRQAFLPAGWTSRRARAQRVYTNPSTELTHCTTLAARAAESSSRSRLMSGSPTEQAENKKPGGSRPAGD